jgi:hypothetical protein
MAIISEHSEEQSSVGSWLTLLLLAGRALMIAAVSARRLPKLTLEGAIEGSLRFVSDVCRDFRDAA